MNLKDKFKSALLEFDKLKAENILNSFNTSTKIESVSGLIMETLSELETEWTKGKIALSQIYMSSRICEELVEKMLPPQNTISLTNTQIAIATLMDYHLLGKKIVCSVMRSSGFKLIDFGSIISIDDLVNKTIKAKIEILLISTLMYHSALKVKALITEFNKAGHEVKILVGGAPFIFDQQLWKQVGADAMGNSASDAIKIVGQWIKKS